MSDKMWKDIPKLDDDSLRTEIFSASVWAVDASEALWAKIWEKELKIYDMWINIYKMVVLKFYIRLYVLFPIIHLDLTLSVPIATKVDQSKNPSFRQKRVTYNTANMSLKHFWKMELLSHAGMSDHIALEGWHTKG